MEPHELANEVLRQRKAVLQDGRRPIAVRLHMQYQPVMYRVEQFLVQAPFTHTGEPDPTAPYGRIYGLEVRFDFAPGIRVLPDDWHGDGQGATRP